MEKIRILLVDDHKLVREGIISIIKTTDTIKVIGECSSGEEAIKYIGKNEDSIDVVLMDISMPGLNGIEATKIITKAHPKVKIISLTMHAEETYIMKMVNSGARGYILKDTSRERLIEAIEKVNEGERFYSKDVSVKLINVLLNDVKEHSRSLSKRESQILKQITLGVTTRQIAVELNISGRTVETHRRNIIKKLEVKNTAELVSYAISNGLVE